MNAAEAINLTLPWIPEGEVAFMYAASKQGFWAKRGLDVTITRGFGSGRSGKERRPRNATNTARPISAP